VLSLDTLESMLDHLTNAQYLEGPAFEEHYQTLLDRYRAAAVRDMPHAPALLVDETGDIFRDLLSDASMALPAAQVRGLIAPHLDYPRGRPCYAGAYGLLKGSPPPDRVVVLGTNHFGRSTSVVATGKNFRTPLGTTRVDLEFLASLELRCGDLRRFELDHEREHSIELQVAWLQFLFGADRFQFVPFLCPDPCRPTGTKPQENDGVDLSDFAQALRDVIAADKRETLIVAGADLSHVGAAFGDDRRLEDDFLAEVRRHDEDALKHLEAGSPGDFVRTLSDTENRTRVCSAGCIFALAMALPNANVRVLRYHQAVNQETQTCVTCAAAVFT
ncbi:MAG: AmmeMemoRadiSam system protein B, partial [Thermoplasmata archaeon]